MDIKPLDRNERRPPKRQLSQIKRCQPLQNIRRLRPLERQQPPILQHLQLDFTLPTSQGVGGVPFVKFLAEPGEVAVSAAGVGDDVEGGGGVFGDDCVVDYATGGVEADGEGGCVRGEGGEGGWG